MEQFMRTDRAKHAVLAISKFGLMQITRQRMKPEMNINTRKFAQVAAVQAKFLPHWCLKMRSKKILSYLIMQKHKGSYHRSTPNSICIPYKRLSVKANEMENQFKERIKIRPNTNYHLTEFHFFDKNNEEIKLQL